MPNQLCVADPILFRQVHPEPCIGCVTLLNRNLCFVEQDKGILLINIEEDVQQMLGILKPILLDGFCCRILHFALLISHHQQGVAQGLVLQKDVSIATDLPSEILSHDIYDFELEQGAILTLDCPRGEVCQSSILNKGAEGGLQLLRNIPLLVEDELIAIQ